MNPENDFLPIEVAYCHSEEMWLPSSEFYWLGHIVGQYKFIEGPWEDIIALEGARNIENRLIPRAICNICIEAGFTLDMLYENEEKAPLFRFIQRTNLV